MPIRAPAMHPAAPLTSAAVMIAAARPNVVASPLEEPPAIKAMLAPIETVDNPLSTPPTPPMAAPVCFAVAFFVTVEEPHLGHFII